jgi:hypothetical protein
LQSTEGIVGIDNGLTFHHEGKLRTVLWGWSNEPITEGERLLIARTLEIIEGDLHEPLSAWLSPLEIDTLQARCHNLLERGVLPEPDPARRCIPWPVF